MIAAAAGTPGRRRGWLFGLLALLLPLWADAQSGAAKAYVYLEPYSARVECLIRLADALPMLGEKALSSLEPADQERVKKLAITRAGGWPKLKVEGLGDGSLSFDGASIVLGEPGRTQPLNPGEPVAVKEGMVGLVWVRDLPGIFEAITFEWGGFGGGISELPVSVIAGGTADEFTLTPSSPALGWRNRGRVTLRSALAEVPAVPVVEKLQVPLGSILWIVLGTVFLIVNLRRGRKVPGRVLVTLASIVLGAVVFWPVLNFAVDAPGSSAKPVEPERAGKILSALLRNIYKSFDRRNQSEVYDVLARSVHGRLLEKLYLQIVSALTLDAQEGTRVRLDEAPGLTNPFVQVDEVVMLRGKQGFVADVRWTVIGTVGHWGHQHQRVNRYKAKVTVEPVAPDVPRNSPAAGEWKITALDVEEERRM